MHMLGAALLMPTLYLDPGSGSLLIQLLLAGILGVGVFAKIFWRKITAFFGGKKSDPTPPSQPDDDQH